MNEGCILVVDDEETIRFLLDDYFTSLGYKVVTTCDGEEALSKYIPGAFDCVISDLVMPKIDGLELLQRIKHQDHDVYFLMITAYPKIDNALKAMKEGAYDYIIKPFHMEDIQLKVERILSVKKVINR